MAFKFKNKKAFERKIKLIQRAGREMGKSLTNEIGRDYIFTLGRNTPMAPKRDADGKKIKGRGLAKSAWYQMLNQFGKKNNKGRKLPPGSSTVITRKKKGKRTATLINAIDYIGYLDKGGRNTPPSNILAKSAIEMKRTTERRLKNQGRALERLWRR